MAIFHIFAFLHKIKDAIIFFSFHFINNMCLMIFTPLK